MSILVVGLVFCGSSPAFAVSAIDYLVDPYVGYSVLGVSSVGPGKYSNIQTNYASYNGLTFGARAGVQFMDLLFLAADGSYTPSLFTKTNAIGSTYNSTPNDPLITQGASNTKVGVVAGFSMPIVGVRLWVGYNFLDDLTGTSSSILHGYSLKVGASYSLLALFSLNAEFLASNYAKFSYQGAASISNPAGKVSNSQLLISIGVPIYL